MKIRIGIMAMLCMCIISSLAFADPVVAKVERDGVPMDAYRRNEEITEVIIPDYALFIGSGAFANCENLQSVTISEGVEEIQINAFFGCSSLTDIYIPSSVSLIEQTAFNNCINLRSITVAPDNPVYESIDGVLFDKVNHVLIHYPYDRANKVYEVPKNTKGIRPQTYGNLERIVFPEGIERIDEGVIQACYSLRSIELPDSMISLESYAINRCRQLSDVQLPPNLKTIGNGVFFDCDIAEVCIPESVTSIGSLAYGGCPVEELYIPKGVTSIGGGAFAGCKQLKKIEVDPENPVYKAEDNVLFNKVEGELVLYSAGLGSEYSIPYGTRSIAEKAFWRSGIVQLEIPDTVEEICEDAFRMTRALKSVVIPESVKRIGSQAFCESNLETITLPQGLESIEYGAFEYAQIASITIPNGVRYIQDNTFGSCNHLKNIDLPENLISIGDWAFSNCRELESIEIPGETQSIGERAFMGCESLKEVHFMGESLTSIGEEAFRDCVSLQTIHIPNSVTNIEGNAFIGCSEELVLIVGPGSAAEKYAQSYGINYVYQ